MLNLNPTTLAAVVDKARTDAAEHPRWLAAIDRAVVELAQNPGSSGRAARRDYRQPERQPVQRQRHLPVHGRPLQPPCWHRAAARLVERHDQRQAQPVASPADMAARIARARQEAEQARAALLECWS